jgi:hypothetical protein
MVRHQLEKNMDHMRELKPLWKAAGEYPTYRSKWPMKPESRSSKAWKRFGARPDFSYRFELWKSGCRQPLFTIFEGCRWAPVPAELPPLARAVSGL